MQPLVWILVILSTYCVPTANAAHLINPSLKSWYQSAKTGRADLLVIGDSMVWFGGDGWDAGLQYGARQTIGLAGTGLIAGLSQGQGEDWGYSGSYSSAWTGGSLRGDARYVTTLGVSNASSAAGLLGIGINGTGLNPKAAYTYDVWASAGNGGGYALFNRRLAQPGWNVRKSVLTAIPRLVGRPRRFSAYFAATNDPSTELYLDAAYNISVYYQRAYIRDKPGITVTSLGYGGRSTRAFYTDKYAAMHPFGRREWLNAITTGGNGKLTVVIAEGFNDRNENLPSLRGHPVGNSPVAFIDNIKTLMAAIRQDWLDAGHATADLSFVLLGMYDIESGNGLLTEYAAELYRLAASDPAVSFINLRELGPSYAVGQSRRLYSDIIHLNRSGALLYGEQIMRTIANAVR